MYCTRCIRRVRRSKRSRQTGKSPGRKIDARIRYETSNSPRTRRVWTSVGRKHSFAGSFALLLLLFPGQYTCLLRRRKKIQPPGPAGPFEKCRSALAAPKAPLVVRTCPRGRRTHPDSLATTGYYKRISIFGIYLGRSASHQSSRAQWRRVAGVRFTYTTCFFLFSSKYKKRFARFIVTTRVSVGGKSERVPSPKLVGPCISSVAPSAVCSYPRRRTRLRRLSPRNYYYYYHNASK